jgi:hypothetical protein
VRPILHAIGCNWTCWCKGAKGGCARGHLWGLGSIGPTGIVASEVAVGAAATNESSICSNEASQRVSFTFFLAVKLQASRFALALSPGTCLPISRAHLLSA